MITTSAAAPLQDALDRLVTGPISEGTTALLGALGLGETWLTGLVVDGLVAGVGMLLTFVPLMALMFVLLSVPEDSGYMARAAVVTDRMMRWLGLPGRGSFRWSSASGATSRPLPEHACCATFGSGC